MTRRTAIASLALGAASCARWLRPVQASPSFAAFSLAEAQKRLRTNNRDTAIASLGGFTRLLGLVHDRARGDLVLVGHARATGDSVALDDFVAAIRALVGRTEWPLVSIDKMPDTGTTGKQRVRFEGVSRCGFAEQLLAADLFLKRAALGLPPADTLPIPSFFSLCEDAARRDAWTGHVSSRLWFHPLEASMLVREDVVAIRQLNVGVRTEVVSDVAGLRDELSDEYAAAFTTHLEQIASGASEVRRLKNLFDIVALVSQLESFENADLQYWLSDYPLPDVAIPEELPLLRRTASVENAGRLRSLEVDGGVDMRLLATRLYEGDHTAFRDAVLRSRPDRTALSWRVPLGGWRFFGEANGPTSGSAPESEPVLGSYLERRVFDPPTGAGGRFDPRGGVTTDVKINPKDFARKP
jgi:hypothetical protein